MRAAGSPFLVREEIVSLIEKRMEALERGYRQNVGLVGFPGCGKTSFLASLFTSLCAQPKFIPIYINADSIDFDHFAERWLGALLTGLFLSQGIQTLPQFHSLLLAADPIVPVTTEKIRNFKKMMRREKPVAVVKELFALVGSLSQETGKKIIFMMDEFDRLESFSPAEPFAAFGREIVVQKDTFYLVASSSPARAKLIFSEKLSMLFGNFEVLELANFGFAETLRFFEKTFPDKILTPAQKQFLVRMTDGLPVYLDLIADQLKNSLAAALANGASLMPASEKISDLYFLEAFFRELANEKGRIAHLFERKLSKCQRFGKDPSAFVRTLVAIARGRRRVPAIAAAIGRKAPETKKILTRLLEEDLIRRRGTFYSLGDPLFRFWLREVFEKRSQIYTPEESYLHDELLASLNEEWQKASGEEAPDIPARLEGLFKEFRNDVLEVAQKKIVCPQFSEIQMKPCHTGSIVLAARSAKVKWHCQAVFEKVREEDVLDFLEDLKKYRRKPQAKILILLRGIEQNAKLMAQEAGIQLWDLRTLNELLELYELPKIVLLQDQEKRYDGSHVGALAQSVHSA